MADDAPQSDPKPTWLRRVRLPGGLSARLLLATALVVVLANAIIIPILLATRQRDWLSDRVAAGELASLVLEAAPGGKVTEQLKENILNTAGVVAVGIQADGVMSSVLAPPRAPHVSYRLDLRQDDPWSSLTGPLETLFNGGGQLVLVTDRPHFRPGELVQILVPDAPLRAVLLQDLGELLIGALFTSAMAGALVYLFLSFLLVRPMQRITRAMERFRADPEDPQSQLAPSGRHDEIGRAELELGLMQADLRAALASRARLAALGEAVAKINHEMRNMLTSAQMASERLAASGDPVVARTLPRLERALDRAVTLATNVLAFGRSEEPTPATQAVPLRAALEAAAEDAQLDVGGVALALSMDDRAQVLADPDQLHRIFVNLMRNAREAIDGDTAKERHGAMTIDLAVENGASVVRIADDGPGLPLRARANLFQPFQGSTRRGGAGLGLAISRELAQAHGGDLVLVDTGPTGTLFELRLPGAPDPLPPEGRTTARTGA
ncbi:MAG TPA: HAMP domain-containing sensor histidine kinase [Caulobacteraceae bacterium]|jgi:signal transduction histidine kinase